MWCMTFQRMAPPPGTSGAMVVMSSETATVHSSSAERAGAATAGWAGAGAPAGAAGAGLAGAGAAGWQAASRPPAAATPLVASEARRNVRRLSDDPRGSLAGWDACFGDLAMISNPLGYQGRPQRSYRNPTSLV